MRTDAQLHPLAHRCCQRAAIVRSAACQVASATGRLGTHLLTGRESQEVQWLGLSLGTELVGGRVAGLWRDTGRLNMA